MDNATATTNTATPNFEFFQGTLSESSTRPQITVRRGGLMVITRAAVDMLGDAVTHVQLAYDGKTGTVGIRTATEDTAGAYRLRTQPKGPSRLVSGKRFFQHHGLTVDKAHTYTAETFGNGIVGFRLTAAEATEPATESAADATPAPAKKAAPRKIKTAA